MILPRFNVLVPESVDEACRMLVDNAEAGVRLLAGGTDLLVDLRSPIIPQHVPRCDGCSVHPQGRVLSTIDCSVAEPDPLMASEGSLRTALTGSRGASPAVLVSLHKLGSLKGIEKRDDGGLRVGSLTTIVDIKRSTVVRDGWTALGEGADNLGSPLVRNRGTIGGNIANARPAADTAIPTLALGGVLTLQCDSGIRKIEAKDFATGPGQSVIKPNEILTEINYPSPPAYSASAYYKLANRKALEISTVGVAVSMSLEERSGSVAELRVAFGAVGPTPILSESVGEVLVGKLPDEKLLAEAARVAAGDARPIDDHRGSALYRLQMVETLTLRLLKLVLKRIEGES